MLTGVKLIFLRHIANNENVLTGEILFFTCTYNPKVSIMCQNHSYFYTRPNVYTTTSL